ncbi:helix-turn-helix domain-containing protein [Turicibacter sanguinis]|nr:helix-turn-helix domain-containing protein [Turicibacter sanguinis]MTN83321.1 helix-turn-helix domain-containing protein [Turicibacter sanguinis]MTN86720.1 helix-turn-helix domain-containing protein [Turicibacter sanguinis]MTN88886.1 helix-turn-helix domain-containing protein [Turicibacter sanguinis]MTN91516.1 helix-turn-helix domain-containing protein [Turicibacter sanguinis]
MVNSAKIKGRLIELGLTQKEVSRKLGLAQPTFNQKLNNIRVFDLEEAEKLQEILNIPDEQFIDYFFMKSVA